MPSLPGFAQIFASATARIVSDELVVASPLYDTVAVFENVPAAVVLTVIVIGADVAAAPIVPMLQVTGPAPAHPVCETNAVPAGMFSAMITLLIAAFV